MALSAELIGGRQVSNLPPDRYERAARLGQHAYGFQYHVEITASTVSDWEAIPEYKASLEQALGVAEASRLSGKVAARLPDFGRAARRLNDNLMAVIDQASPNARP